MIICFERVCFQTLYPFGWLTSFWKEKNFGWIVTEFACVLQTLLFNHFYTDKCHIAQSNVMKPYWIAQINELIAKYTTFSLYLKMNLKSLRSSTSVPVSSVQLILFSWLHSIRTKVDFFSIFFLDLFRWHFSHPLAAIVECEEYQSSHKLI